MGEYNHGKAMDLLAECLRRNRAKTTAARLDARRAEIKASIRAGRKARAIRFLLGPGRAGLNIAWQILIWISQITAWILMLTVAIAFAEAITAGLDLGSTHGELAAIAVYGVSVVAGIRAARDVSRGLRAYARTF